MLGAPDAVDQADSPSACGDVPRGEGAQQDGWSQLPVGFEASVATRPQISNILRLLASVRGIHDTCLPTCLSHAKMSTLWPLGTVSAPRADATLVCTRVDRAQPFAVPAALSAHFPGGAELL